MALIKCLECNREKISDSAKSCPHCGFKPNAEKNKRRNKIILWSVILGLLALGAIALSVYIASEREEARMAQIEFNNFLAESLMPGSYQDARYAIVGTHPNWELIDNTAGASIYIEFKLQEDEKNGVPFKQSQVYKNWGSYFRKKSNN